MINLTLGGLAVLMLMLMILPALTKRNDFTRWIFGDYQPKHWRVILREWAGNLGAITVTYLYPVNGTVPPTAIQASQVPTVTALVSYADADSTGIAVTHNFGIATAAGFAGIQPNIAQGFPTVIGPNFTGISTVVATISYTNTSGNVITFTKASLLGTAGTFLVTIRKPHSMGL